MGQRVLDIVRKRSPASLCGLINGGGDEHLVFVVNQLRERVLDTAAPRTEEAVRLPHAIGLRHVVNEQHHALSDRDQ